MELRSRMANGICLASRFLLNSIIIVFRGDRSRPELPTPTLAVAGSGGLLTQSLPTTR